MRRWLRETHSQSFELLRHFVVRFFDSDLVTSREQWVTALIGAFSVLLPWFPILAQPLLHKYGLFSRMATPERYWAALRADELWILTMMMSAVGVVTAVQWQSLFPGKRDYQALGWLPLRPYRIFTAKLGALLLIITALVITLNAFPALVFPAVSHSHWQYHPSMGAHIRVHAVVCAAACYFTFFALVALQGVLLNVLPPRVFGRVTGYLQGLLVALMLVLLVLSFSIQPRTVAALTRAEWWRWIPPVWFMGLYQVMLGDGGALMQALAQRAEWGLAAVVSVALLSYAVSYRRHRELLVEGSAGKSKDRRWAGVLLDWVNPDRRQQGVMVFMAKTLARNSQHRTVLMGYLGFGLAVLLTGVLEMGNAVDASRVTAARFVYAHVILLVFLLIGLRHLFSLPTEWKANWAFQLVEGQGRGEWLRAVDRFVLFWGGMVMLVIPLPLEVRLLGWLAPGEAALFMMFALLCYEWLFSGWEKLPFTCSYLPGKTPGWILVLEFLGLLGALPVVNGLLVACLYNGLAFGLVVAALTAIWWRVHKARTEGWEDLRLKYEEVPDPAVHGLNLMG